MKLFSRLSICLLIFIWVASLLAEVKVTNVEVKPRWPWNGLVDITYSIECDEVDVASGFENVCVEFTGYDRDLDRIIRLKTLTGAGASGPVKAGGLYTVPWNAEADEAGINAKEFAVKVHAMKLGYMVVDLTNWSVYYSENGPDLNDDTCRTTELWLRQIPAGTFMMGSPEDELGHRDDEIQHEVTLKQMFYIGVFECTQRQWELLMGTRPSYFVNDDYYTTRPVECVSYDMIRGNFETAGAGWPTYGHTVDTSSFMGKLQERTELIFDLPTEAQWEYACRAGTTTALNSRKNLTSTGTCPNLDEVGRYWNNGKGYSSGCTTDFGTAKVGSYLPNAWGLYDMHGNVSEWCLDWYDSYSTLAGEDPTGPTAGSQRVLRDGFYNTSANLCRSAFRTKFYRFQRFYYSGFRVACWPLVH